MSKSSRLKQKAAKSQSKTTEKRISGAPGKSSSPVKSIPPNVALMRARAAKTAAQPRGIAKADDAPAMALNLPAAKLSPAMSSLFKKAQEKLGFVPNVLRALSFDMPKLETFVAFRNELMLGNSGLSKLEREMIATVVSAHNRCFYCVAVHGAAVRQESGDPLFGEQITINYRAAKLNARQRAMLDFSVKLTAQPASIEETDRERLRRAGFTDRDIWDIAAVAGFYNMTNRLASATDMRPNNAYHALAR